MYSSILRQIVAVKQPWNFHSKYARPTGFWRQVRALGGSRCLIDTQTDKVLSRQQAAFVWLGCITAIRLRSTRAKVAHQLPRRVTPTQTAPICRTIFSRCATAHDGSRSCVPEYDALTNSAPARANVNSVRKQANGRLRNERLHQSQRHPRFGRITNCANTSNVCNFPVAQTTAIMFSESSAAVIPVTFFSAISSRAIFPIRQNLFVRRSGRRSLLPLQPDGQPLRRRCEFIRDAELTEVDALALNTTASLAMRTPRVSRLRGGCATSLHANNLHPGTIFKDHHYVILCCTKLYAKGQSSLLEDVE